MNTTTITCDRCGDTVEVGRTKLGVEVGTIRSRFMTIDFCQTCGKDFNAWLTARPDRQTAKCRAHPAMSPGGTN